MKRKRAFLIIAAYSAISLSILVLVRLVNGLLLSSSKIVSPDEAFFIEGIIFILLGFLLMLGRGGINQWSQKAAMLAAFASAIFGSDTVGPAETMRQDAWKSKGFIRAGLIMLLAGVFMIAAYFLVLWLTL